MKPTLAIASCLAEPATEIAPAADSHLREILKRCSPCTYYAAHQFQATGDLARIPTVVTGVIERYVARDLRSKLRGESGGRRLQEDLGIDSLSLIEIRILLEDALGITIGDEELRGVATLGQVVGLVEEKVRK